MRPRTTEHPVPPTGPAPWAQRTNPIFWLAAGCLATGDLWTRLHTPAGSANALLNLALAALSTLWLARIWRRETRRIERARRRSGASGGPGSTSGGSRSAALAALPQVVPATLRPLLLFVAVALLALPHSSARLPGAQNLAVYFLFCAATVLGWHGARGTSPEAAQWVLGIGAALGAALFCGSLLLFQSVGFSLVSGRQFTLTLLVGMAVLLTVPGDLVPLWRTLACSCCLIILFSLSRTGFLASELLVVVWWAMGRSGRAAIGRLTIGLSLAVAILLLAVAYFPPMREHALGGDVLTYHSPVDVPSDPGSGDPKTAAVGHQDDSPKVPVPPIRMNGRASYWRAGWHSAEGQLLIGRGTGSVMGVIRSHYPAMDQPLNDYLRLLHDFGVIGLLTWLWAMTRVIRRLRRRVFVGASRAARAARDVDRRPVRGLAWAALAATGAIGFTMLTDNPIVYSFVMLPLGVLIGAGLQQPPTGPEWAADQDADLDLVSALARRRSVRSAIRLGPHPTG